MVERNIKTLLLDELKKTGDKPEEVTCHYRRPSLPNFEQINEQCSAANLPEDDLSTLSCSSKKHSYDLVITDTEIKIVTEPNPDPS